MSEDTHIGSLVRRIADKRHISASKLADKLGCTQSNVYKIYQRWVPDLDLLVSLSAILKHDFTQYLTTNQQSKLQLVVLITNGDITEKLNEIKEIVSMWNSSDMEIPPLF